MGKSCYVAKTLGVVIDDGLCLQLKENEWSPRLG